LRNERENIRANRPGRAENVQLRQQMEAAFAAVPDRRRPAILLVASCEDRLVVWPAAGRLSRQAARTIGAMSDTIAADMGQAPIPLSLPQGWNIEMLMSEIEGAFGPALMVRRNRRRLAGNTGLLGLLRQSGEATARTTGAGASRLWDRIQGSEGPAGPS